MAEKTIEAARPDTAGPQEITRAPEQYLTPAVDIYENGDGLTVVADLPGVAREGLDVRVQEGVLTIQGRAQHPAKGNLVYQEFPLPGYFRQFQLADTVDAAGITAELKHGVLTLFLPRAERAKPKQIEVKVG